MVLFSVKVIPSTNASTANLCECLISPPPLLQRRRGVSKVRYSSCTPSSVAPAWAVTEGAALFIPFEGARLAAAAQRYFPRVTSKTYITHNQHTLPTIHPSIQFTHDSLLSSTHIPTCITNHSLLLLSSYGTTAAAPGGHAIDRSIDQSMQGRAAQGMIQVNKLISEAEGGRIWLCMPA